MLRARALLFAGAAALLLTVSGVAVASAGHGPTAAWGSGEHRTTYNVTFSETGLPTGTHWSVRVSGWASGEGMWGWRLGGSHSSTTSTINFSLPNGTYFYRASSVFGFVTSDPKGTFNVSGASPATITIGYSPRPTYAVTFDETGLASGTNWTVSVFGEWVWGFGWGEFGRMALQSESSTTPTITFQLPNGTYHYRVSGVSGYSLNDSRGSVTVAGTAPSAIAVTFSKLVPYSVEFNESGLPAGTNWTVLIFGFGMDSAGFFHTNATSSSSTISFELTNGTYLYVIERVPGWQISSGMRVGVISVNGASPAETSVVFGQDT
jgi:hypothetical protein